MAEDDLNKEILEVDEVEQFLNREKNKLMIELSEIQEELVKLCISLSGYVEILDREIKDVFENGDDKAWVSLTNKKSIIVQRIIELENVIKKQKCKKPV